MSPLIHALERANPHRPLLRSRFDCVDANSRTFAFIDIRGYSYSLNVPCWYTIAEVATEQTRSRWPTC